MSSSAAAPSRAATGGRARHAAALLSVIRLSVLWDIRTNRPEDFVRIAEGGERKSSSFQAAGCSRASQFSRARRAANGLIGGLLGEQRPRRSSSDLERSPIWVCSQMTIFAA
jgi:hypothetical protein